MYIYTNMRLFISRIFYFFKSKYESNEKVVNSFSRKKFCALRERYTLIRGITLGWVIIRIICGSPPSLRSTPLLFLGQRELLILSYISYRV